MKEEVHNANKNTARDLPENERNRGASAGNDGYAHGPLPPQSLARERAEG